MKQTLTFALAVLLIGGSAKAGASNAPDPKQLNGAPASAGESQPPQLDDKELKELLSIVQEETDVASFARTRFYAPDDPLTSLDGGAKIALLGLVDELARAMDPRVFQVIAQLSGTHDVVLIARRDGRRAADVRPHARLDVKVLIKQGERVEAGSQTIALRSVYTELLQQEQVQACVVSAVETARRNLESRPAPAGTMDVVMGPGWPGVLLHEAVGHGLEGDFNRTGSSAFAGRIGELVAAPGVTVVDNGALPEGRGSLHVDDEGNPTQCTTLIENGVLKGYLHDEQNARLMNVPVTGNGRRMSYAHPPHPRMTNTYMLNGDKDPEEILASVKSGLYIADLSGGQVDITNGKFVFSTTLAYRIENGKLTYPVKGATLVGNGPDCLKRVSMIGNDLAVDGAKGWCVKNGQRIPVGVGQPTIRLDQMTVGGTA